MYIESYPGHVDAHSKGAGNDTLARRGVERVVPVDGVVGKVVDERDRRGRRGRVREQSRLGGRVDCSVYIYIYVCMYVCMYIYIYI